MEKDAGVQVMPFWIYDLIHNDWFDEVDYETKEDAKGAIFEHAANAHDPDLPGQVEVRYVEVEG